MATNFKFTDNSPIFKEAMKAAVEVALEDIGQQAVDYAKDLAPVDTTTLQKSITHQIVGGEQAVYIGTDVPYGKYQEFGTRKMKAQPYLKPAVMNHLSEYKAIAMEHFK